MAVSEARRSMLGKVLTFAAIVEIGTGLALLVDPRIVIVLLVGGSDLGEAIPLGRLAGIALLAFGVACWPDRGHSGSSSPSFRAMLIYNLLIALYLTYLFTIGHLGGISLWPAVALHSVVTLLLVWTWRAERQNESTGQ